VSDRLCLDRPWHALRLVRAVSLVSVLLLLHPAPARCADEVDVSTGATLAGPGLAAHGWDVVSFFSGSPAVGSDQYAVAHGGATYRFVDQKNLDAFKADPTKYEPQYGGFCAYGAALGKKFDGDPRFWKVVDGKLYLNLNGDIQTKWTADIPGNVKKADENWTRIRSTPVGKL
jgi:YHS domain-containing protein